MGKTILYTWFRDDGGNIKQGRVNPQDYLDYLERWWSQPRDVPDLAMIDASVVDVMTLVPERSNLPYYLDLPFFRLVTRWFHEGLPDHFHLLTKEGVDDERAYRHLHVVMASEGVDHAHKMEAVTWLLVNWAEEVHWGYDRWIADHVWERSHNEHGPFEEQHGH